jgi:hypothetical protein
VSNGISLLLISQNINPKTYSVDFQTPDSSATANALFSGVKTDSRTLGYDATIVTYDLKSELNAKKLTTIMEWAQDAGKDTGRSGKMPSPVNLKKGLMINTLNMAQLYFK